jgi:hypothetical protein
MGQEASYTGNYINSTNIDLKLQAYLAGGSGGNIIFQTGASGSGSLTERMRITSGGNVGIGTSSPTAKLQIRSTSAGAATVALFLNNESASLNSEVRLAFGAHENSDISSNRYCYISALNTTASNGNSLLFATNETGSSPVERMRIVSNGQINLNDTVYNNTATAVARILYIGSDYRIGGLASIRESKKNIKDISNVDWIYSLNPVTFNYRKKNEEEKYTEEIYDELVYGLIAEDTAPIADFLVNYNAKEDGTKEMVGIEYMRLITPMLKAIQELKAEIEELKNK